LFRTHESPHRRREWAEGRLVEHQGHFYRVSRWVELRPVALDRGGSVRQWEVWGCRVSARQVRKELLQAAEAILDDGPPDGR
jgi:hypothetical protein